MKRREAIQNIFFLSTGLALMPACDFEHGPVYLNVPLEKGQRTFIELLTNAVLPREGTEVSTPESPTDFILTQLNDCTAPEDIQKFLVGIKEFQQTIKEQHQTSLGKMEVDEQVEFFSTIDTTVPLTEAGKYFFDTVNAFSRQHFIQSEYFLKNVLDWEFAPARYIGCREI